MCKFESPNFQICPVSNAAKGIRLFAFNVFNNDSLSERLKRTQLNRNKS